MQWLLFLKQFAPIIITSGAAAGFLVVKSDSELLPYIRMLFVLSFLYLIINIGIKIPDLLDALRKMSSKNSSQAQSFVTDSGSEELAQPNPDTRSAHTLPPREWTMIMAEAKNASESQDFEREIHFLNKAIAMRPDIGKLYRMRGAARACLNRHPAAIQDLTRALDLGYRDNTVEMHLQLLHAGRRANCRR